MNPISINPSINYIKNNKTMEANQSFSFARFGHLLRRDFNQSGKSFLILMIIMFVVWTINTTANGYAREKELHIMMFPQWLLLGGFIVSSLAFYEFIKPTERQFYLQLPASNLEKFVSRWLLTGIVYTIGLVAYYWLYSLFANWIGISFYEHQFDAFTPFRGNILIAIKSYLAAHTIFLAGAAAFKRFAFFKTLFAAIVLAAIVALCGLTSFRIIFADLFDGLFHFRPEMMIDGKMVPVEPSRKFVATIKEFVPKYAKFMGFIIAPIIMLFIGYFKLKETEL